MAELDLENGETVIMAEWATGSYVNSWEKSFIFLRAPKLYLTAKFVYVEKGWLNTKRELFVISMY